MPYVKRDDEGRVMAISRDPAEGFEEALDSDSPELLEFLGNQQGSVDLSATDADFVRVLEDVVELLIDKGLILFTELPQPAQEKIMRRQQLRSAISGKLDLIGED